MKWIIKHKKKIIFLSLFLFLVIYLWWGNTSIKVTEFSVKSSDLPEQFDGFKVVHVSDLHDGEFGNENSRLIHLIKDTSPDIIAFTGDMIDSNRLDIDLTINFFKKAISIAPCYYVTGNHEASISKENYELLESSLSEIGVFVLKNQEMIIEKNGEKISISGIDDPDFAIKTNKSPASHMSEENLKEVCSFDGYNILLSHRPEYFENYVDSEIDLVLSGHAHGGQVRLPFAGGLLLRTKDFSPIMTAGYTQRIKHICQLAEELETALFP